MEISKIVKAVCNKRDCCCFKQELPALPVQGGVMCVHGRPKSVQQEILAEGSSEHGIRGVLLWILQVLRTVVIGAVPCSLSALHVHPN